MDKYKIKLIDLNSDDFIQYYNLFITCFPEDSTWGQEHILQWLSSLEKATLLYGIFENQKLIGFRHIWHNEKNIAYVPYAGMHPDYRKMGIYPQFCNITENILADMGFQAFVNEVENPDMIDASEKKLLAIKRINMFVGKLGYSIIGNTDEIKYERNMPPFDGEKSLQISQFDYLLGFKLIGNKELFKIVSNSIHKTDYEMLYWIIREIEFMEENNSREYLLTLKPIAHFINCLHNSKEEYINLIQI